MAHFGRVLLSLLPLVAPLSRASADEVYAWQRVGSPALDDALRWSRDVFTGVNRLWLEVTWNDGQPRLVAPTWTPPGGPNGDALSLRITEIRGSWANHARGLTTVVSETCRRLTQVRAVTKVRELQVDFDAIPSQIGPYAEFLASLSDCALPTPVTFTALPNWLESRAFAPLAQAFPHYVLQIHSLEHRQGTPLPTIYRSAQARSAVARAANLGVPFRIALPAYLYDVALDASTGRVVAVNAEQRPRSKPNAQVTRRTIGPDVRDLARDLAQWRAQPPRGLEGRIWFRLPVAGDERAFSRELLAALVRDLPFDVKPVAYTVKRGDDPKLVDIVAGGHSGYEQPLPRRLNISWRTGKLLAAEVFPPCRLVSHVPGAAQVTCDDGAGTAWLPPGREKLVMWIRVADASEVKVNAPD